MHVKLMCTELYILDGNGVLYDGEDSFSGSDYSDGVLYTSQVHLN